MRTPSLALTFLGAAGTVTGSKTLVEGGASRLLVDCGLFQGERDLRRRNWAPFPAQASALDAVTLTHAHLDHCGYLPRLYDEGFAGPTYATPSTAELTKIVLVDSAHLLEEEARHASVHGWSKHDNPLPLYDQASAARAIGRVTAVAVDTKNELAPGCFATWRHAGHILGSATVSLEVDGVRGLFTGDLGRPNHPLLRPPEPPDPADVIVVESTYGDRKHPEGGTQELCDAVNRTVRRGGSVLIPAFAVDRTEILLHALHELRASGAIPDVPIVLDSPMALRALEVYRAAFAGGAPDTRPGERAFLEPSEVQVLATAEESQRVNAPDYPMIIISASGMATGGRVLHHLRHQLPHPRNTVLLVGYQAFGTRGRSLLEGERTLKLFGQYIPVRAEIVDIPGFSVHADADEIIAWLGQLQEPPSLCLVNHGEPKASETLRDRITDELGWTTVVPRLGERILVRSS